MASPFPILTRILLPALIALAAGPCPAQTDPPALAVLPIAGSFRTGAGPVRGAALERKGDQVYLVPGGPAKAARPPADSSALGERIYQRVAAAFFRTRRFRVLERAQLRAVIREEAFGQEGLVDDASAARLGRLVGARLVAVGSYTGTLSRKETVRTGLFGGRTEEVSHTGQLELDLRLVDAETGALGELLAIRAQAVDPDAARAFEALLADFTARLEREVDRRYPLAGCVVKALSDTEALVDLGLKQGVAAGDLFVILAQGPDQIHPVTGRPVKGGRRSLGQARIVLVGEDSATVESTGGPLPWQPGQIVERQVP